MKADEEQDTLLVARCLKDYSAFEDLVRKYEKTVYRLTYYWVGNRDDALDLAQECFIRLYQVLPKYDPTYRFSIWLYRVCTNVCINWLKANRKHRQSVPLSVLPAQLLEIPDGSDHLVNYLVRQEKKEMVLEAVKNLKETYRIPVLLRYMEGFSYKEIAAILGISVKNVEIRLHRAKEMLHQQLKVYFEEPEEG